MRINVYSQELTAEVEVVTAVARDTGIPHKGVRMYLKSPDCLHNTTDDDDRSAITFWIPVGVNFSPAWLAKIFTNMASAVRSAGVEEPSHGGTD